MDNVEQGAAPNVCPRHASCWSLRSWQESRRGQPWVSFDVSQKEMRCILAIFLLLPCCVFAEEQKEYGDYNFDDHEDYRVYRYANGKRSYYDYYLFDKETNDFKKDEQFSRLFNAVFVKATNQIYCISSGGHSGAIFYREDYLLKDGELQLLSTTFQDSAQLDGKLFYIRVTSIIEDGKPITSEIKVIKPEEINNG